jgi:hypothetical protein
MSLKQAEKEFQISGKGHKETLEIVKSMKHTTDVPDAFDGHVPGSGGT